MEAKRIPEVILNSGHKMPVLGLGTSADNLPPNDTLVSILIDAIEVGYRHFDSASVYRTEEALGQAVAKAVNQGLIQSRDEVFITTKPWNTDAHPDLILPSLRNSLK